MIYDAVIFDVDGVLIDTSRSFTAAVVDAVAVATGSPRFTVEEVRQLKIIRGFNNEWVVAVVGAAWLRFRDTLPFTEFARNIDGHGGGLTGLRQVIGERLTPQFEARVVRLAQEAYGGTTACKRLYGIEPTTLHGPGRWREEVPLLPVEVIRPLISRVGIVSGRYAPEMELAFQLLGWRLPPEQVAISDDPAFDKPNPVRLLAILRRLASRQALFVGDTRDDLELVRNARREGAAIDFCYIGFSPAPWPEVAHEYPSVLNMLEHIEVQYDQSATD
ncbi:MAG: HAD-IA family hydrolase [Fidelibacterota bacterium]|nr:MAG: HAD-IA family hydrolase [Candidatus Neomarinimicrobiota bacterium]